MAGRRLEYSSSGSEPVYSAILDMKGRAAVKTKPELKVPSELTVSPRSVTTSFVLALTVIPSFEKTATPAKTPGGAIRLTLLLIVKFDPKPAESRATTSPPALTALMAA